MIAREPVEGDTYDPRVRPWYRGAVETGGLFWTDVYAFYTDKKPGITAAAPSYNASGELLGVLSLDIELDRISQFLSEMRISPRGRAVVVTTDGKVVAHPDVSKTMRTVGEKLVPAMVSEIDDPAVRRAFDRYRTDGPGRRTLELGDRRFISLASPLPKEFGQPWVVLVVAPESDFLSTVEASHRESKLIALAVLGCGVLLAGVVIASNVRAERRTARELTQLRQLGAHAEKLAEFVGTREGGSTEGQDKRADAVLRAAHIARAERASVWALDSRARQLSLEGVVDGDAFQPGELQYRFTGGDELKTLNEPMPVGDVYRSSLLSELEGYFRAVGVRAVVIVPVATRDGSLQYLMLERRGSRHRWNDSELRFARTAARALGRAQPAASATAASIDTASPKADDVDPRRQAVLDSVASGITPGDVSAGRASSTRRPSLS